MKYTPKYKLTSAPGRRILSLLLTAGLILSSAPAAKAAPKENQYEIGLCLSDDSQRDRCFSDGFRDALVDNLGAESIRLTQQISDNTHTAAAICRDYTTMNVDLIFTVGDDALNAACDSTSTIPIVCTDVMDIQEALHLIPRESGEWNRKTGINVTGVSDLPDISGQLSLMLETRHDISAVGILYSAQDKFAIYQNDLLEDLLDEAGIPWKEYELESTSEATETSKQTAEPVVVVPEYTVAANAKEGANIDVEPFGEDGDLTGINSPNSTRTAQISENWTDAMSKSKKMPKSDKARIKLACKECSFLYIPARSDLGKRMKTIRKEAKKARVYTFGGDISIGQNTLTCLYADPYDEGYSAGKMACRILDENDNPGSITVGSISDTAQQKLYSQKLAGQYKKSFPKSFDSIEKFTEEYTPGERTERTKAE